MTGEKQRLERVLTDYRAARAKKIADHDELEAALDAADLAAKRYFAALPAPCFCGVNDEDKAIIEARSKEYSAAIRHAGEIRNKQQRDKT